MQKIVLRSFKINLIKGVKLFSYIQHLFQLPMLSWQIFWSLYILYKNHKIKFLFDIQWKNDQTNKPNIITWIIFLFSSIFFNTWHCNKNPIQNSSTISDLLCHLVIKIKIERLIITHSDSKFYKLIPCIYLLIVECNI